MTEAIRQRNITVFNYLAAHLPPRETLEGKLHYPDLNMPGLSQHDIAELSKFINPETKDKTVQ